MVAAQNHDALINRIMIVRHKMNVIMTKIVMTTAHQQQISVKAPQKNVAILKSPNAPQKTITVQKTALTIQTQTAPNVLKMKIVMMIMPVLRIHVVQTKPVFIMQQTKAAILTKNASP